MSEHPKFNILHVYQLKTKAAEEALATHFVAFVRVRQKGNRPLGYLVYATDGDMGVVSNPNFVLFYTSPPGHHFRDVQDFLDAVQQSVRRNYDDSDFHSTVALHALSSYARMTLEDVHEPNALAVCLFVLDCARNVRWMDYAGKTNGAPTAGPGKVFLTGCYNAKVRQEVESLLQTTFLAKKVSRPAIKKTLAKLKRLTKLKRVSYIPLTF